jgi:hypothetical protein
MRRNKTLTVSLCLLLLASSVIFQGCFGGKTKPGRIIVTNAVDSFSNSENISFTLSYGSEIGYPDGLSLGDGGQADSGFTLPPGTYSINEVIPEGWEVDIVIIDPTGDSVQSNGTATIVLSAGETVTVRYSNVVSKGRIVLINQMITKADSLLFRFLLSYGNKVLYPDGLSMGDGQQVDSGFTLEPGTHVIIETVPANWKLPDITIDDPSGGSYSSGDTAVINLTAGETVTVTFTNSLQHTPTTTRPLPTTLPPLSIDPKYGGRLTLTRSAEIQTWDPVANEGDVVLDLVYQRLWQGDWTKGPAGGYGTASTGWLSDSSDWNLKTGAIAESCTRTVDQASGRGIIVYGIRQGIRWQTIAGRNASQIVNGRELTADDVVFCMHRAITDNNAYIKQHYPELTAALITRTGDWEVTVSVPSSGLDSAVNVFSGYVYIYPPELISGFGNLQDWQNAIGSGPFSLTQVVPGSSTTLTRNLDFWMLDPVGPGKGNQLPYLESVRILVIPDRATRLAALRSGKIEYLAGISSDDALPLTQQYKVLQQTISGSSYSLWWPWLRNYSGEDTIGFSERIWPQYVWYDSSLKSNLGY